MQKFVREKALKVSFTTPGSGHVPGCITRAIKMASCSLRQLVQLACFVTTLAMNFKKYIERPSRALRS
jgi:hypothetical protein